LLPLLTGRGKDTMNTYTEAVWEIVSDTPELLAELTAIMGKQYQPFLGDAQAYRVNTHRLKAYFLEKLNQWFEWLHDTAINHMGGALALEALQAVDWSDIALQVRLVPLIAEGK